MKLVLLTAIKIYKLFIPPLLRQTLGTHCRFEKTCSDYAADAISKKGAVKGCWIALKRLSTCHPLSRNYEYI